MGIMQAIKLTTPDKTSIIHNLLSPATSILPTGSVGEMLLIPYARTPMNAPIAIPILFIRVCIAKQIPSPRSPVFHSR